MTHQFNKDTANRIFKRHENMTAKAYGRMNGNIVDDDDGNNINEAWREN